MPILASEGCFWPLTASITSEAKINYAYVTTQGICNNFIEVNFCMGPMVWRPNPLFQDSTTMSLINKIKMDPNSNSNITVINFLADYRISCYRNND